MSDISLIALRAPNPIYDRFLREITASLGVPVETYTPQHSETLMKAGRRGLVLWHMQGQDHDLPKAVHGSFDFFVTIGDPICAGGSADAHFDLPLRPGMLIARLRTLLYSSSINRLPVHVIIGPYCLKAHENILENQKTKEILRLTDKERDILLILAEAKGAPVERQTLLDRVWAYAPTVETHTLETHMYRLRQKIERDPGNPELVLTDERGYKLSDF